MSTHANRPLPRPVRSRMAISALFFILGSGFGSWAVRIPDVQAEFALSKPMLGTALLAIAIGSLIGMALAGALAARRDAAPGTRDYAVAFAVALALIPHAPGYAGLCLALLLFGAVNGMLGVAMNAQASLFEQRLGIPILSSCHGIFSLGALGGSLSSGALADAGVSPAVHLAGAGALLTVLAMVIAPFLIHAPPARGTPAFALPDRGLLAFGVLAFCGLLCEGAVTDWSTVYLRDQMDASPGAAGTGYAAFACAMAAGRLIGDRLGVAWGPRRLVRAAGGVALLGAVVILLTPSTIVAVTGFAFLGTGLSVVFPSTLAAAAGHARDRVDGAIAAVSTVGYFGFLMGPPVIGYIASLTGLRGGLAIVAVCACGVVVLAKSLNGSGEAAAVESRYC
ncbi:MFS transporter [Sphaerisporangium aureirubrum]|uniref:MFS transporter n=1 Tax=Sphaerisporangium aureirubrum TaxID=1544736 RepID=A0ABW1NSV5_9ACTN